VKTFKITRAVAISLLSLINQVSGIRYVEGASSNRSRSW
jgi:hypothetical protein